MPFTFLALLALFAPAWSQQVTHLTYNLSNPRIHAGASAWGATFIAIAGGKTATGWSSDIDVFDTKAKKWTTGHLPVARADQGGPAEGPLPGGKAFFGGQIAPDSEGTVVVMDSTTGQEVLCLCFITSLKTKPLIFMHFSENHALHLCYACSPSLCPR